jgi:hypothetical protein
MFALDEHVLVRLLSYPYELGTYHIMQYRANVRMEPTRSSDVVAVLSFHDEIEILENSLIAERINGVRSFWYKIKYGNIIGYTFGGNIAIETFVTDIDNNGINDYFYFRYSFIAENRVNPPLGDVVIYINNQGISTTVLKTTRVRYGGVYQKCKFTEREGYVLINLLQSGGDNFSDYINYFKITSDGIITYIGNNMENDEYNRYVPNW